jgi:hypothetical protein
MWVSPRGVSTPERRETMTTTTDERNLVLELAAEFGAEDLYGIYRPLYKYTDCGPSIGFEIRGLPADHETRQGAPWREGDGDLWLYCDDLHKLGTFEEMAAEGLEVTGISVSSIVEGSDVEIEGEQLPVTATKEEFWEVVKAVDEEAKFYWERDNSSWYCLRRKDDHGDSYAFHENWGDITHDQEVTPEIAELMEKYVETGGNTTWEENWGKQTHPHDKWACLAATIRSKGHDAPPRADEWEVVEYLNDCLWE